MQDLVPQVFWGGLQGFQWRRIAELETGRMFSGLFFSPYLFSTTWPGLFLALFFPQLRIFNNFSALFSGLFRFVFGARFFVISNFSALFFKNRVFLSHAFWWPKTTPNGFSHLRALCRPARLLNPFG